MRKIARILLWSFVLTSFAMGSWTYGQDKEEGRDEKKAEGESEKEPAEPPAKAAPKPAPKPPPKPAQPEKAEKPAEPGKDGKGFEPKIEGSITAKYKIRYTEYDDPDSGAQVDESDQDLHLFLRLSLKNLYEDKIHFHVLGGYNFDVWGRQDSKYTDEAFHFADVYDTYDHKAHGNLYAAYLELDDFPLEGLGVSIGRHHLDKGTSLHLDGLSVDYTPDDVVTFTAFAGLPVYFWKAHMLDNYTAGGYVEVFPFALAGDVPRDTTKLTFEYIWVSEDSDGEGIQDNFLSVVFDQKLFQRTVDLQLRASVLNGQFRDFKVRGILREPENDIRLRIQYYTLPHKLDDDLSIDMSPFQEVMGAYYPYNEFRIDIYKGFEDQFGLELGYHGRMLKKERHEGTFNHDFDRVYLTGSAYNVLGSHIDLVLTVEYIQSMTPDDEDKILTAGFDLNYRFNKNLKFGLGTHFHRWEMKFLSTQETVVELENVRLFHLFLDFRPVPDLKLGVRYSFETVGGDLEHEYDRFALTATYSF